MKKIIFILPSLAGGGAERTIIQLANNLSEFNLTIHLAVCSLEGNKSKLVSEISPKVKLVNFNCGRVLNAILPLKDRLNSENYDYLISTQSHTNIIAVFTKILAKSNTKLILREVSTPSQNNKLKAHKKFFLKALVNFTYPIAEKVVCVSKGAEIDFKEYYEYKKNNLTTIYNPVLDDIFYEKLKVPVKHKFFNDNKKVILAVGRLTEAKNFDLLIRSFRSLHNQYNETRLIILGEGELRGQLENLVKDLNLSEVVDLPGFDINPYAYFKYISLFVLSSSWEGLPGVLIQALASRVNIVSTDCPSGPKEILDNSNFGLLVECNNPASMTRAMEKAIFGKYVKYSESDLIEHIHQFHKITVVEKYLNIMGL